MRKRWILVGAFGVVCGVAAVTAGMADTYRGGAGFRAGQYAGQRHRGWGERPIGRLIRGNLASIAAMFRDLNLTQGQRTQIRQVLAEHMTEVELAARLLVEGHRALRDEVLAESPDRAAIRQAGTDLGDAIGSAAVVAADIVADIRRILTPEQVERIRESRRERDRNVDGWLERIGEGRAE